MILDQFRKNEKLILKYTFQFFLFTSLNNSCYRKEDLVFNAIAKSSIMLKREKVGFQRHIRIRFFLILFLILFLNVNDLFAQNCSSYTAWTPGMWIGPSGSNCGSPSGGATVSYNGRIYTHRGYCSSAGPGSWDFLDIGPCSSCTALSSGSLTTPATICSGTQTGINGTSVSGAIYGWEKEGTLNANNWVAIGGNTQNLSSTTIGNLTTTTRFRRRTAACNPIQYSGYVTVTITVSTSPTQPSSITGTAMQCPAQTSQTYSIAAVTNATTYVWSVPSGWTITAGAGSTSITVTTGSASQNGNISVTSQNSCGTSTARTLAAIVSATNTVGTASPTPTSCIYNALSNITHTTTGATGISNSGVAGANGLPSGIAASWASNTITISGTPSVSGTFNYTIPLTGGCGSVSATGTIIIQATPSGNFSYSNYAFCSSVNASQAITSNFTGPTGTFSAAAGLNLNTTTGGITPSLSSPNAYVVTYSIPASSGCPSYSTTTNVTIEQAGSGTITYNPSTICLNASGTISPTITNTGGSGTPWFTVSPNGLNITNSGVITPIGSVAGTYTITYNKPNSGPCPAYSNSTTVTLSALASGTAGAASSTPTLCINSALTNITHVTTGATGIGTAIGLPAGVTASWASNTITISGNPTTGGTYNYSIPLTGGCGAVNAIGSITVTQPSTIISVNGNTIGDGDYLWNGKLNTNANVKNNWYVLNNGIYSEASQAPQATDEVFVVSAADAVSCVSNSNNLIIPAAGNFNSNSINIGPSASVSLGNGASLNVKGDFINDGNFNAGSGIVVMNGTSLQKIKGAAAITTFKNLKINNSNGVKIEKAVVVDSVLMLTTGLLDLGSEHLTIGTTALISGTPGNSKMIIASGTGELRKQFSAGTYNPASFTFPVGTSNGTNKYNPVVLDFISGTFGASAYVGVRIQDQKNALLHAVHTTYINKNWIVEPNNGVTNFNYNIKLYFNPATIAQGGDFVTASGQTIGDLLPIKYSGGQWYQPVDGTFTNALAQGISGVIVTNYLSWDGLTTFSEFGGVGGSNNPLPVELLSFSGTCEEGIVNMAWQTASEFNSSHFDVEKSTDGETWRVMATIPSAGTSNELLTYQAMDNNGTNVSNYYRLRQVDNDGKEKLYDPINVSCIETTAGYFTSYPNPSGNEFQVVVNNKEILGACTLNIVDVHGKVIDQRSIDMKEGINMFVISETLNQGIYFLNITNGTKTTQVIKHAIR